MIMPAAIINEWQYTSPSDIINTAAVVVAAAPGVGRRHRVTGVHVVNTDTAVGTLVQLLSGATAIWTGFVGPFVALAPGTSIDGEQFAAKSLIGGDNEAISVVCITDSAQVRASVQGVTVAG